MEKPFKYTVDVPIFSGREQWVTDLPVNLPLGLTTLDTSEDRIYPFKSDNSKFIISVSLSHVDNKGIKSTTDMVWNQLAAFIPKALRDKLGSTIPTQIYMGKKGKVLEIKLLPDTILTKEEQEKADYEAFKAKIAAGKAKIEADNEPVETDTVFNSFHTNEKRVLFPKYDLSEMIKNSQNNRFQEIVSKEDLKIKEEKKNKTERTKGIIYLLLFVIGLIILIAISVNDCSNNRSQRYEMNYRP